MMGTKKLSEIRKELKKAVVDNQKELKAWVNQQGKRKNRGHSRVLEELAWLRDILREALAEKKLQDRKSKRPGKKTAKIR